MSVAGVDFGWPDRAPDLVALSQRAPAARIDALRYCLQGSFLHNLLEWTAVCLAVLTALIAFIHFALTTLFTRWLRTTSSIAWRTQHDSFRSRGRLRACSAAS
jgi:hypothetical protein